MIILEVLKVSVNVTAIDPNASMHRSSDTVVAV